MSPAAQAGFLFNRRRLRCSAIYVNNFFVIKAINLFSLQNLFKMPDSKIPAVLLLEDGTVCHGKAFGAIGTTAGEICFNTGMTGYQEVFTDPSYYGQILIMNTVHIGNYGVKDEDVESDNVKIRGLIGRNLEDQYSRKLAKGSLARLSESQ